MHNKMHVSLRLEGNRGRLKVKVTVLGHKMCHIVIVYVLGEHVNTYNTTK